ncbi:MAG: ABC transporter ATP-binding protein, partial [Rhodopila sp.]|nr:ABC transporter ATP-binding protein [Rhodopila sp.]
RHVRDEIRALQQMLKLTVVYVTHDQQEALAVSDRVIVMNAGRIAQDGSPRELYEQPVSRFVADFIGDANLMPVTVHGIDEATAAVSLGAITLSLPRRGLADGAAELAVRPQALRLAHGAIGPVLPGQIRKASYLGSHMEYEVALDGIAGEFFVSDPDVARPLAAGDPAGILVDPAAVALVPPE